MVVIESFAQARVLNKVCSLLCFANFHRVFFFELGSGSMFCVNRVLLLRTLGFPEHCFPCVYFSSHICRCLAGFLHSLLLPCIALQCACRRSAIRRMASPRAAGLTSRLRWWSPSHSKVKLHHLIASSYFAAFLLRFSFIPCSRVLVAECRIYAPNLLTSKLPLSCACPSELRFHRGLSLFACFIAAPAQVWVVASLSRLQSNEPQDESPGQMNWCA